jgi:hypothetical protein
MKRLFVVLIALLVVISACNKKGELPVLPITNSKPTIVRISPIEDRYILGPESNYSVKVQVADNEGVYKINVYRSFFTGPWVPGAVPIGDENVLVNPTFFINDVSGEVTYNGTVPNATITPIGTTIRLRFEVVDLDSNKAFTDFFINVMNVTPVNGDSVLTYDSCTIYNNLKGQFQYYSFNFNNNSPTSFWDRDIMENTTLAPGFMKEFISPNNTADTAVFARVTDFLNYDALVRNIDSYDIVRNAFLVTEPKLHKTWTLSPGEIYILKQRISGQPYQPYVVFKILSITDDPGFENDKIVFSYKRVVPIP